MSNQILSYILDMQAVATPGGVKLIIAACLLGTVLAIISAGRRSDRHGS